jgi:hypothetical protein
MTGGSYAEPGHLPIDSHQRISRAAATKEHELYVNIVIFPTLNLIKMLIKKIIHDDVILLLLQRAGHPIAPRFLTVAACAVLPNAKAPRSPAHGSGHRRRRVHHDSDVFLLPYLTPVPTTTDPIRK